MQINLYAEREREGLTFKYMKQKNWKKNPELLYLELNWATCLFKDRTITKNHNSTTLKASQEIARGCLQSSITS